VVPLSTEGNPHRIVPRLKIERTPRLEKDGSVRVKLQNAILVGNYQNQVGQPAL
jgi:hypothetical protein